MNLFKKKNPTAALNAKYRQLMEQAMQAQRSGDIVKSSEIHGDAEKILKEIHNIESSN